MREVALNRKEKYTVSIAASQKSQMSASANLELMETDSRTKAYENVDNLMPEYKFGSALNAVMHQMEKFEKIIREFECTIATRTKKEDVSPGRSGDLLESEVMEALLNKLAARCAISETRGESEQNRGS